MATRPLVHPRLTTTALFDRFDTVVSVEEAIDTYDSSGSPVTTWTPYPTLDGVAVQFQWPGARAAGVVQENVPVIRRIDTPEIRLPFAPQIKQRDRVRVLATDDTWLVEAVRHDSQRILTTLSLEDIDIALETA